MAKRMILFSYDQASVVQSLDMQWTSIRQTNIRELKHQRFLSDARQPEVAFFHFLTVVLRKFSVKSPL